jgi:DNA replication and repair protein RecF
VQFRQLRIDNLRILEHVELELGPGWNLFLGANGAGKTTVLEAAFLLSHGRSFRGGAREALARMGGDGYSIYGDLVEPSGVARHVGIARTDGRLEARLDGIPVAAAELMRHVAVSCFEPGSHDLIAGPSDERRRFLDWGVFHVEPEFLGIWRRYQRALKQRNALLRRAAPDADLAPWDHELAHAAEPLTRMRRDYLDALRPQILALAGDLLVELGEPRLHFQPGFDADQSLETALAARRHRDQLRGHTGAGPHRADWSLTFERAPRREHLSRGQEKLCAFACVLGQARRLAADTGAWPVICLDDLASEMDLPHQRRIVATAGASGAQILATGTHEPDAIAHLEAPVRRFHVEQGRVAVLL